MAVVSKERNFLKVNQFFCQMLGYSKKELLEFNVADITHPDDMKESLRLNRTILEKKCGHFNYRKRYIKKDGTTLWVLLTVSLGKAENGDHYFITQIQDLSDQIELEKAREIRALDAIIVTYHHEINNPLAIAVGVKNQLREEKSVSESDLKKLDKAFERIVEILRKIEEVVRRQQEITYARYGEANEMLQLDSNHHDNNGLSRTDKK